LGRGQAFGMLLETLGAEELLADGLFVIPWRRPRGAPERAKDRQFQACAVDVDGAWAQLREPGRAQIPVAAGGAGKGQGMGVNLLIC